MKNLLINNSTSGKLIRTILQGIIGVFIANIDLITGLFSVSPEAKTLLVAFTMAILSPIMSELGKTIDQSNK